ncbi:hypothetical protein SUGI_1170410 [Cryptomeria japonica]|nr:hypothetical protein SUGI_1170410 [Cryptomeria japonica]
MIGFDVVKQGALQLGHELKAFLVAGCYRVRGLPCIYFLCDAIYGNQYIWPRGVELSSCATKRIGGDPEGRRNSEIVFAKPLKETKWYF